MPKKICIVHDSFSHLGGAERVLLELITVFPDADVFIPIIKQEFKKNITKKGKGKLYVAPFNRLMIPDKLASFLKPLVYLYWKFLDLGQYDLVISSSHSFSAKSVRVPHGTPHLCYLHTPPRYLYEEFNEMTWIQKFPWKILLYPFFILARKLDYSDAQKPSILIANSKNVQKRVRRYYQRDSHVVYPPVSVPKKITTSKPKHYLCISRLVRQKGVELAIQTCNVLREKLIVVGTGAQLQELQKIAGPTISFVGFIPDKNMASYYKNTKALLYCSIDEDFGLVPVEAQAHGVPVIAYKSGGTLETILHKKTGLFFSSYTVSSLVKAIKKSQTINFSPTACRKNAAQFDRSVFRYKMQQLVHHYLEKS